MRPLDTRSFLPASSSGLLALALLTAPPAHAGLGHIEAPIVNGQPAKASELHATVSIVTASSGQSSCTGTLVAPQLVVTAAHCVVEQDPDTDEITSTYPPSEFVVVAGLLDAALATDDDSYPVTDVVVHPGYPNKGGSSHPSGAGRYDDVALLVLERAVDGLALATIPSVEEADEVLTSGATITLTGYGTTASDSDATGVLYIAESEFDTREDVEIVVGGDGMADTCPGDSGGPAYYLGSGELWLVGITSRAVETSTATCGEGGIYAFAPAYRDWIASNSNGLYTPGGTPGPDPNADGSDEGEGGDGTGGEGTAANAASGGGSDGGGCSTTGSTGSATWLLALSGLLWMAARRTRPRGVGHGV